MKGAIDSRTVTAVWAADPTVEQTGAGGPP